jgi:hypothetical protein
MVGSTWLLSSASLGGSGFRARPLFAAETTGVMRGKGETKGTKMSRWQTILAPVWFLAILWPTPVKASSAAPPEPFPDNAATNVPINASILILSISGYREYNLWASSGPIEYVSMNSESIEGVQPLTALITPTLDLEPNTSYDLAWEPTGPGDSGLTQFTTGSALDEQHPEWNGFSRISFSEAPLEHGCICSGTYYALDVAISPATDDSYVYYEIQVDYDDRFEYPEYRLSPDPQFTISDVRGHGIESQDRIWFRARTIDLAGHASEWSPAESVVVEAEVRIVAEKRVPSLTPIILAGLLRLRRRPSSNHPSGA